MVNVANMLVQLLCASVKLLFNRHISVTTDNWMSFLYYH